MLLPACSCPDTLLALLWARGWQDSTTQNPIHHRRKQGHLCLVFLGWWAGKEPQLCPASSSTIKIHQQLLPCAPHPRQPPAKGTRNSPSVSPPQ